MTITRSTGMQVGMWSPGGGYSGCTNKLDDYVATAAQLLEQHFQRDIEIRFNSDRKSGGAFFKGLPFSVGVNATLWNLAESRRFFDRWVCIHEKNKPFAEFCAERKLNAKGPNEQYTFDAYPDNSHRGIIAMEWRLIEALPLTADPPEGKTWPEGTRYLLFSPRLGVVVGECWNWRGIKRANVSMFHGCAIENWGVSHWMPLPVDPA